MITAKNLFIGLSISLRCGLVWFDPFTAANLLRAHPLGVEVDSALQLLHGIKCNEDASGE
jgi:hypothetical protein